MNNIRLSEEVLSDFKTNICNENQIIPEVLKKHFLEYFEEPVYDIGSGLGDISTKVVPDKQVVHVDTEAYLGEGLPEKHSRITGDFFHFVPEQKIGTLFMSHVLQYIDSDIKKLNNRITELNPAYIITVTNTNEGALGEFIKYFDVRGISINPERNINNFPKGYTALKREIFIANVKADSFEELVKQLIVVIIEAQLDEQQVYEFIEFVKEKLPKPEFKLEEQIIVYGKS